MGSTLVTFTNDPIKQIDFQSQFYGYNSGVNRPTTGADNQQAYNYSVDLMYDQSLNTYRMYTGGRWRVVQAGYSSSAFGSGVAADGDHVLQSQSPTGVGGTWVMPQTNLPASGVGSANTNPQYWNGQDYNLAPNAWYADNSLQPQVFKLGGTYYMYSQVEIDAGKPIDIPGQTAAVQADRIELFTSPDGNNWTRFTDRGVVTDITDPTHTWLGDEEFVYEPWDTATPYHLYVAASINGVFQGYQLLTSNTPYTYDWSHRQSAGLAQLGNGIGYCQNAPGGPLLLNITFSDDATGRAVPSLQFSRNGTDWFWGDGGPVLLAGSTDNNHNENCYFLGISTLDGLGQIQYLGNNTYEAIYGASTANSPVSPDIWYSEIGVGKLTFTITPVPEPSVVALLMTAGLVLLVRVQMARGCVRNP
ncbi:MAG: PEP-CTERM sorting domain-containing protein [Thermoguttaceae bacterium]